MYVCMGGGGMGEFVYESTGGLSSSYFWEPEIYTQITGTV